MYVRFEDGGGNATSDLTQSITLDTTGPTGTITNAAGTPTNQTTPTLNLTISDSGVGTTGAQMQFSCDNIAWSTWESYATSKTNFNVDTGAGCTNADGTKAVYVEYQDSLGNVGNSLNTGSFTLDTTAPALSNGAPNNQTFSVTITSTNLTLTTSEVSVCRYSTSPNTAYASMTNTFDTSDGLSHSAFVAGLQAGASYTYYVRCTDLAGNVTLTDYPLTFNIAPLSRSVTLNTVKVKISRAFKTFKDTIKLTADQLIFQRHNDPALANGTIKIYKGNTLMKPIVADAQGAWNKTMNLAKRSSQVIKLYFYDKWGTLLGIIQAKVKAR